jgi:hypothetical protein
LPQGVSAKAGGKPERERVFAAHRRTLRLESTPLLCLALPAALERYSLQLQAEHPLMVCTPVPFTEA